MSSEWISNNNGPGFTSHPYGIATSVTGIMLFTLLAAICFFSLPAIRNRHHNLFELTHRYCGWALVRAAPLRGARGAALQRLHPPF